MKLGLVGLMLLAAAVFAMPLGARAEVTSITLLPGAGTNVSGNAGTSAPGFVSGSWQSPGVGGKSESYIAASTLFPTFGAVTINDLASISYWTNKSGTTADVDWTFLIYTAPTGIGTGDVSPGYHSRLNAEPYFTQTPNASVTANTWHEWTSGGANALLFYDQPRGGSFGTYADPTLADLQAGTVTWGNSVTYDYRTSADTISYFSLQTGSAWANGFNGLVDGMTITLKNGDVGIVNFEATAAGAAVPLPIAAWMGISLVGGLGGFRGIKRLRSR